MPNSHDPYAPQDPEAYEARTGNEPKPAPVEVKEEAPAVPKGTTAEVLDWVGDSKERASLALQAEEDSGKPRKGLVEELTEISAK